jgi:ADP-ribosyl-[dinitrogen reductase] hydrolase
MDDQSSPSPDPDSNLDANGLMFPPWLKYPELERYSIGWRMGGGEGYMDEFQQWWKGQTWGVREAMMRAYPAEGEWAGFYGVTQRDAFRGALLGLACGDAVGTTVEFQKRGMFYDMTDMVGGGPFGLQPGQWTDDTSMALCLAASLAEKGGFDAHDQMMRYCRWMDEGYMSSIGRCFDIGMTTHRALDDFKMTGKPFSGPTGPLTAGNGSIMRLAPVPMFFFANHDKAIELSGESSRTTHGADECIECCRLFGAMLHLALNGCRDKHEILLGHGLEYFKSKAVASIAQGEYRFKNSFDIRGTGYVVKSLEAALWCFCETGNFKDAILKAANLGDDADTTAAVCGQLAGAFYGESGIPAHWLQKLAMGEEIGKLAEKLMKG